MSELSIQEALDIVNSDFKLWERATDTPTKTGVSKTLVLPWGIGEVTVNVEGVHDAKTRRNAVGMYGEYIRGLVKEATDDEAVTSRAAAKAARAEQADSGDSDGVNAVGVSGRPPEEEATTDAGEAHEEAFETAPDLGADLLARRAALVTRLDRLRAEVERCEREGRGIDSALTAMGIEVPE